MKDMFGEGWRPWIEQYRVEGWDAEEVGFVPVTWLREVANALLEELGVLKTAEVIPRRTDNGEEWSPQLEALENKRCRIALAWMLPNTVRFAEVAGFVEDWPRKPEEVRELDVANKEARKHAALLQSDAWLKEFRERLDVWLAVGVNAAWYGMSNRSWDGNHDGMRRRFRKAVWALVSLHKACEKIAEHWEKKAPALM